MATSPGTLVSPPPATPAVEAGVQPPTGFGPPNWGVPPEFVPRVDDIVIEDDKPVDNIHSEKNVRLLTEPLYTSWPGPGEGRPFAVLANVGLFHTWKAPPVVPDVMLSLDIRLSSDLSQKENNTYFVWILGKVPDVAGEIVSNREGGEDTDKLATYARLHIPYYVIFDPRNLLGKGVLRIYQLRWPQYELLSTTSPTWLEGIGLGLMLWEGRYEDVITTWLRWCDRDGQPIPTGAEAAAAQRQRTEAERQRAEAERQRAEAERQRAEAERQRAEQAQEELERLQAHLRTLGIEPPS